MKTILRLEREDILLEVLEMVSFSVPIAGKGAGSEAGRFRFSVRSRTVLVAGLRHAKIGAATCRRLLDQLHLLGFHFFVGCASGVDLSFREALSLSPYRTDAFVACAFAGRMYRARSRGLFAQVVVPPGIPPKAALSSGWSSAARWCCSFPRAP